MVALFASLKYRILVNRVASAKGVAKYGWLFGLILSAAASGFLAFGLVQLRQYPAMAPLLIATAYFSLALAWLVMPLVAFGVDETLDPRRFALLPLPTSTLQRGLLVAALIGYLPLANVIFLGGSAVALSSSWALLPVAIVCALLLLLMCIVLARALAATVASLMASRRGRDLGMFVSFGIFALYFLVTALLGKTGESKIDQSLFTTVAEVLGFTPPGALGVIPSDVAAGNWTMVALRSAIVLVTFAAGWLWWQAALRKTLTTVGSTTQSSAVAGGLAGSEAVATDMRQTARLIFGRNLTMTWRDPMRRLPWMMVVLLAVVWPFLAAKGPAAAFAPYYCAFGAAMCGTQAGASYSLEGTGLWLHMVAFADTVRARGELWGNAMIAILGGGGLTVIAVFIQVIANGAWDLLVPALGLCIAVVFGSTAMALFTNAYLPYATPQSRTSMFANKVPGQGGRTVVTSLAIVFGGLIPALPSAALAWLYHEQGGPWGWFSLVAGLLVGSFAVIMAIRLAAERYLATTPEIFEVIRAGDRV